MPQPKKEEAKVEDIKTIVIPEDADDPVSWRRR